MVSKFFFITLLLFNTAFSQGVDYSKAKMFYELKTEEVDISIKNGNLKIMNKIHENKRFNKNVSIGYSTDKVYEGYFFKVNDLVAKIGYLKKNGNYKYKKVKDVALKSNFSGGSLYDDNSFYEIRYPNVKPGTSTLLDYEIEIKDPHFYRRFFFTGYIPSKKVSYTITSD